MPKILDYLLIVTRQPLGSKISTAFQMGMEAMQDLAGLGKIAEVIANSIGKVTGAIIEPARLVRLERAKSDAEAYAIERRAMAEARADILRREIKEEAEVSRSHAADIRLRAARRIVTQETIRQGNIEAIAAVAFDNSAKSESEGASPCLIDDDWILAFIEYAQNVSHDDLRNLWAGILSFQATEGAPKVSKATLDAIRLIEPGQAKVFERAVRLYLAMGQILDVDAIEGVDVGYLSQMREATALEDLGLLKRVRDLEQNLDIQWGVLSFWRDYHPHPKTGELVPWSNPGAQEEFLRGINRVARGKERDHVRMRESIRIERQILTSRGFELASVIFPDFYRSNGADRFVDPAELGDFGIPAVQEAILDQWAEKFSTQGAAVTLSLPAGSDQALSKADVTEGPDPTVQGGTHFSPEKIFQSGQGVWLDI